MVTRVVPIAAHSVFSVSASVCLAHSTKHRDRGERNHTRGCTCISASLVSSLSYALTWQLSVERSQDRVIRGDYSSSAHFSLSSVRRTFLIGDVASVPAAAAAAAVTTNSAMAMANEISLFVSWALPASPARIVYCLSTTYRLFYLLFDFRCAFGAGVREIRTDSLPSHALTLLPRIIIIDFKLQRASVHGSKSNIRRIIIRFNIFNPTVL